MNNLCSKLEINTNIKAKIAASGNDPRISYIKKDIKIYKEKSLKSISEEGTSEDESYSSDYMTISDFEIDKNSDIKEDKKIYKAASSGWGSEEESSSGKRFSSESEDKVILKTGIKPKKRMKALITYTKTDVKPKSKCSMKFKAPFFSASNLAFKEDMNPSKLESSGSSSEEGSSEEESSSSDSDSERKNDVIADIKAGDRTEKIKIPLSKEEAKFSKNISSVSSSSEDNSILDASSSDSEEIHKKDKEPKYKSRYSGNAISPSSSGISGKEPDDNIFANSEQASKFVELASSTYDLSLISQAELYSIIGKDPKITANVLEKVLEWIIPHKQS